MRTQYWCIPDTATKSRFVVTILNLSCLDLATFPLSCCFITHSYPSIWQIEHKYVPIHINDPSQYISIRSQFSNDFAKVGLEDLPSGCFG